MLKITDMLSIRYRKAAIVTVASSLIFSGVAAYASHSWGGYHWARISNPFTLKLGDNVSSTWDAYLATTSGDWSLSSVLNTTIVAGQTTKNRNCRPTSGRVEVCNSAYGNNGWLGIASVWVSGTHIVQGTVKMNDTYFNTAKYNTAAWRNLVMCQETGHTFGLDHQDETFDNPNLGTCMDYTNDPSTNQHPNKHDYDELEAIYAHLDSTSTLSQKASSAAAGDEALEGPGDWGREIHRSGDGHASLYERDLGHGHKVFTFVTWAN